MTETQRSRSTVAARVRFERLLGMSVDEDDRIAFDEDDDDEEVEVSIGLSLEVFLDGESDFSSCSLFLSAARERTLV